MKPTAEERAAEALTCPTCWSGQSCEKMAAKVTEAIYRAYIDGRQDMFFESLERRIAALEARVAEAAGKPEVRRP